MTKSVFTRTNLPLPAERTKERAGCAYRCCWGRCRWMERLAGGEGRWTEWRRRRTCVSACCCWIGSEATRSEVRGAEGERSQIVQTLGRTTRVKTGRQTVTTLIMHVQWAHGGRNNEQYWNQGAKMMGGANTWMATIRKKWRKCGSKMRIFFFFLLTGNILAVVLPCFLWSIVCGTWKYCFGEYRQD